MLGTFLDKMSGFFDQRFVIAYLIPILIGLVLALSLVVVLLKPTIAIILDWWINRNGPELTLLGGVFLFIIILLVYLLAYLLATLTTPIVRLYEGYWSEGSLTHKVRTRLEKRLAAQQRALDIREEVLAAQQRALDSSEGILANQQETLARQEVALADKKKALHAKRTYIEAIQYVNFPRNPNFLKPTRLGNVLAAAEEYSSQIYRLDAVIWWPRLAPLLPDEFRVQIDTALTPMLMMLNLSLIFTLMALIGGGVMLFDKQLLFFMAIFIGGLLLARACYFAAVSQAVDYGNWIRVAFDLYRHEPLKKMHIPTPDNLVEEGLLWTSLNNWLYRYTPPWDISLSSKVAKLERPFYYDTHPPAATLVQMQEGSTTSKGNAQTNEI